MKLASVFSLKEELTASLAVNINPVPRVFSARGASAVSAAFARTIDATHTRTPQSSEVALGVAPGKGRGDFRLGARVQRAGAAGQRIAAELRDKARGEVDVRIVPSVRKRLPPSWFRRRQRPLEAGLSVGHVDITAGTLGFVVEDTDAYYVLSNNHVLANVNNAQPGDPILSPGPIDIAAKRPLSPRTLIGVLDRFVPISFRRSNVVDCAVAELRDDVDFFVGWTEALPGVVKGVKPVTVDDLGRPVVKAGRTTGVTKGVITQVNLDRLGVDMSDTNAPMVALFSDQIEVEGDSEPFSRGGDSGSVIVDTNGFARALLFAGGPDEDGRDLTFANQLATALQKLGVRLTLG